MIKAARFVFLLSLGIALSGCVSIQVERSYPRKPIRRTEPLNKRYISLSRLSKDYKLLLHWDSVTRKATLKRDGIEVVLAIGARSILINGRLEILEKPPRYLKGDIYVSDELRARLDTLSRRFPVKPVPQFSHRIKKIVIDAGHGGRDPGAIGCTGLKEKDINLNLALRVEKLLKTYGIETILTRQKDIFIPLKKRAEIANSVGADLFVSIHANAWKRASRGFEVFYLSEAIDASARAVAAVENAPLRFEKETFGKEDAALKATLWDMLYTENRIESMELARAVVDSMDHRLSTPNRGVKFARFYVLKYTRMPAILIEVGFLTNPQEERMLKNTYYRQMLAEAIVKGILEYKDRYEKTNGFTL